MMEANDTCEVNDQPSSSQLMVQLLRKRSVVIHAVGLRLRELGSESEKSLKVEFDIWALQE